MVKHRSLLALLSCLAVLLALAVVAAGAARADVPNPDCTLTVPAHPLTAAGLATPYELAATDPGAGACHETNATQAAFVEAAILDPASGALTVYHPVVVDTGTQPHAAPVPVVLPLDAVVAVWFGSNGDTLRLAGPGAGAATTGLGGSVFGQFSYIGARAFFPAAQVAINAGKLVVPPLGTAVDGKPCPTTRDFVVVDQDQSDNVGTFYWTDGTSMSQVPVVGWTKMSNGSDEGTLANRIDPALGCTPWKVPSLDQPGTLTASLAANELSAKAHQAAPMALVPLDDPMTLVDGHYSVGKTNAYRSGVGQPHLFTGQTPVEYCTDIVTLGQPRLLANKTVLSAAASPSPGVTLFDFLTARMATALTVLGCPTPANMPPQRAHHGHPHPGRDD